MTQNGKMDVILVRGWFILAQVSDVEDETNGFITYDRQVVKVEEEKVNKTMRSLVEEARRFGTTEEATK